MKSSPFTIDRVDVTAGSVTYPTYKVKGWLNGRRIRRQFKDRNQALGEKLRLEILAANSREEISAVNTRLSSSEVAEAETAFRRLAGRSLSLAVDWFLETYRPPSTAMRIELATAAFLLERLPHVSHFVKLGYKRLCKGLIASFATREIHMIRTEELQAWLATKKLGNKGFNNARGELHSFFEFCRQAPREWCKENPAKPLPQRRITRGIPRIETAERLGELFKFLETYAGPPRAKCTPGCLVPYFALATFAGIRPSLPAGEIWKLGRLKPDALARAIDLNVGVLRIGPEISKTKDLRQIVVQPNLRAWLQRYPLERYPILIPNLQKMVARLRTKFGLSHDVLRHSFCSYHVAKFKSLGSTALEAGNSERIIKRHYLNSVTEKEAGAFWSIAPGAL